MKWLDMPPVWLAAFIALAWAQAWLLPTGLSLDHPATDLLSGLLIGAGLVLMALAVTELRRKSQEAFSTGASKVSRKGRYCERRWKM